MSKSGSPSIWLVQNQSIKSYFISQLKDQTYVQYIDKYYIYVVVILSKEEEEEEVYLSHIYQHPFD